MLAHTTLSGPRRLAAILGGALLLAACTSRPEALVPSASTNSPSASASAAGVPASVGLKRVPQDVSSGPGWRASSSGTVTVLRDDVVLDGLLIPGSVQNGHDGLRISNSQISCIGENDWCVTLGNRSSVVSSEIGGQADGHTYGHAVAIYSGGSSAGNLIDRVEIHHQVSGIRLDGGTTVTNSWIHDLPMGDRVLNFGTGQSSTADHSGGIMSTRNANVVLRGNRIEGGNTANLFVQHDVTDDSAPLISNWLVENNTFVNVTKNGQSSSWGVRIEPDGVRGPITVRNNTFSRGWQVEPISAPALVTQSGNTYTDKTPV